MLLRHTPPLPARTTHTKPRGGANHRWEEVHAQGRCVYLKDGKMFYSLRSGVKWHTVILLRQQNNRARVTVWSSRLIISNHSEESIAFSFTGIVSTSLKFNVMLACMHTHTQAKQMQFHSLIFTSSHLHSLCFICFHGNMFVFVTVCLLAVQRDTTPATDFIQLTHWHNTPPHYSIHPVERAISHKLGPLCEIPSSRRLLGANCANQFGLFTWCVHSLFY